MLYLEIIVPFFIAGVGICFAGIIFSHVQFWSAFREVGELFIIVPAILGLKGNLQMTLASRFSTHSHLGHLQSRADMLRLAFASIALNQTFSIIISLAASLLAVIINSFVTSKLHEIQDSLTVTMTALVTSTVTSFILDILMIMIVLACSRFNINPDNVATPIAASLGDLTSLILFAFVSACLYDIRSMDHFYYITLIVIFIYVFLIPLYITMTQENLYTARILTNISSWYPLLTAMFISSFSGIVLRLTVARRNDDIALFQPLICGVGGNLVAVQLSRLSTLLHQNQPFGKLPPGETVCMSPLHLITSTAPGYDVTRFLMFIVIPGQIFFYYFTISINTYQVQVKWSFFGLYMGVAELQVVILLYLAYVFTYTLWVNRVDPDNSTIPYLSSISDALGAVLVSTILWIDDPAPMIAKRLITANASESMID